jgi:hypothetical protein
MGNDKTVRLFAKGVAQYLLLSLNTPLAKAIKLITCPGSLKCFNRLYDTRSELFGPVPRSIGVDLISFISAEKIQQSLDIKHVKKTSSSTASTTSSNASNSLSSKRKSSSSLLTLKRNSSNLHANEQFEKFDRIKPKFQLDLVYNHPVSIWIRFYTKVDRNHLENICNVAPNVTLLPVNNSGVVYELYLIKNVNLAARLMNILEKEYDADLIFCSELPMFHYNSLLFLSNYIKFMWCYSLNRDIFDPILPHDVKALSIYSTYGLLFLNTNNLTNMPRETHNPFIACTGERPKMAISKFEKNKVYINEGSRALQTLNKPSDFGTKSNFIENIIEIDVSVFPLYLHDIL